MTSVDIGSAAASAEKVVEAIAKAEPVVASIAGMFVPGAAPVIAVVQPWMTLVIPYIERGLNDIAAGNGGDMMSAVIEMLQHVSKGQPNSSVLTPAVTPG